MKFFAFIGFLFTLGILNAQFNKDLDNLIAAKLKYDSLLENEHRIEAYNYMYSHLEKNEINKRTEYYNLFDAALKDSLFVFAEKALKKSLSLGLRSSHIQYANFLTNNKLLKENVSNWKEYNNQVIRNTEKYFERKQEYPALDSVLYSLKVSDQFDRGTRQREKYGEEKWLLVKDSLWKVQKQYDVQNQQFLDSIINLTGSWPNSKIFSDTAAHVAWLIAQHCDNDSSKQKYYFDLLYDSWNENSVSTQDMCYLYDRVLVNHGEKQVFGTQMDWKEGKNFPRPLRYSMDETEIIRKQFGMPSLKWYLEMSYEHFKKK